MGKKQFLFVFILACILFSFTGCEKDEPKGGDGCGMFDNAKEIRITYEETTYHITDSKKVNKLIELSRSARWKDPEEENYYYSKEDCNIKVEYIGARATLWLSDSEDYGFLDDSFVVIPNEIDSFVKEEIKE